MTPLPRPTPHGAVFRKRYGYEATSSEKLRWSQRRPTTPMPSQDVVDTAIAHINGRPYRGHVVEAVGGGVPDDEMDAGFLAAIRLAPRIVGTADGEVPLAVAGRLYDAGLIRRAEAKKSEQE